MAKKKTQTPTGFEDLLGNLYSNADQGDAVTDLTNDHFEEITVVDDDDDNEPPVNTEDGNDKDKTDDTNHDNLSDDSDIPDDVLNNNVEPNDDADDEPNDADVIEAQQVGLLFDAVGQSLGWNMADIDEKDRPLTVDDLTKYLSEVVKENSVPQYANDQVQMLDEYIKNGGRFEDFYSKQQEAMSIENIDMDDETNQKAVIRELLKHSNYTDEQINKKIARYEDADMLYEESEDALERLKQIRKQELEEERLQQEEYARQQAEQSKQFFDSVTTEINQLTNIRGISIPKEDRKALFDYIFKVDQDGYSQYQKDFNKNLSKNLIESAYFTMKADQLVSTAKKDGESSAAEKLRKMLRHSTKNHSTYNADERQKQVTDLVKGLF